jgi:putative Holliday junction resolvase
MRRPGDELPITGRLVAFDLGRVRVGVAVSDPVAGRRVPEDTVASRTSTSVSDGRRRAGARPAGRRGTRTERPGSWSAHRSRSTVDEGEAAREARAVADALREASGLPVRLVDERFTTTEAERTSSRRTCRAPVAAGSSTGSPRACCSRGCSPRRRTSAREEGERGRAPRPVGPRNRDAVREGEGAVARSPCWPRSLVGLLGGRPSWPSGGDDERPGGRRRRPRPAPVVYEVRAGQTVRSVGDDLAELDVIDSTLRFRRVARRRGSRACCVRVASC